MRPTPRRIAIGVVSALTAAGIAAWQLWPHPEPENDQDFLEFTACLLTDHDGLQGTDAARIWTGLQQAQQQTRAKVRYFATSGPQTTENASALLASLVQQHCRLIFATGDRPVAATRQDAAQHNDVDFYLIGGGTDTANLHHIAVSLPTDISTKVAAIVTESVRNQ